MVFVGQEGLLIVPEGIEMEKCVQHILDNEGLLIVPEGIEIIIGRSTIF